MFRALGKSHLSQHLNLCALSHNYGTQTTSSKCKASSDISSVPGLSENCVKVPANPVGPGASKGSEYKNPEYFCYHAESFAEAEVELAKFRLPAPSNKKKFGQ
ncbi:uncharacterized protein LOC105698122 [Orussus abietinus]|uniref:uncharacterized protein LOC105698122 n=1 Tax=Orussus abietinus TaxID=222816 RepID=UPI00062668D8|nr:uncharacterized protein LOC105698122 [Orussus abietinus]